MAQASSSSTSFGALRRAAATGGGAGGAAAVFVAEDDARLHRDFAARLEALLRALRERPRPCDALWLHARGHARVRDTCDDATCVPPPDAPATAAAAVWGAARYFDDWPIYGPTASVEWTGHPVMACDPAALLATPRACGRLADALHARLAAGPWAPADWLFAALARDAGAVLCGDPYLLMPAPRRAFASVRGEGARQAGAVMGRRVFDAA